MRVRRHSLIDVATFHLPIDSLPLSHNICCSRLFFMAGSQCDDIVTRLHAFQCFHIDFPGSGFLQIYSSPLVFPFPCRSEFHGYLVVTPVTRFGYQYSSPHPRHKYNQTIPFFPMSVTSPFYSCHAYWEC